MTIGVIGAGAFGTGLAISIAKAGTPVRMWARNPDHAALMCERRENTLRLPGIPLPDLLTPTSDVDEAFEPSTLLLAVPMQKLRSLMETYPDALSGKTLVASCKGIELTTGKGPIELIKELAPNSTPAILTGPSFASDIAKGLPTAQTLAVDDDRLGVTLQEELTTPNLRLYRTTDTTGAELGGALKNVMAIACGVVMGAELGESARAALMTRGYAEMVRMAVGLGGLPETLAGLSGFGDLALTCTSSQSRNYRFGLSLGRGEDFDPSITVEGAATARAVTERATEMGIEMPISEAVVALQEQKLSVSEVVNMLLSRPLKEE